MDMTLGEILKQNVARLGTGKTQIQIAADSGLKQSYISRAAGGGAGNIKIGTLAALAKGLGCAPWQLLMPEGESTVARSEYEKMKSERDQAKITAEEIGKFLNLSPARRRLLDAFAAYDDSQLESALPGIERLVLIEIGKLSLEPADNAKRTPKPQLKR